MEKLHNCPNCGGTLEDDGRCRFCGSKVYDFINIDFDKYPKTYVRIRFQDKVATMPVVFTSCQYSIGFNPIEYGWECMKVFPEISGTIDYRVVGKTIWEEGDK